MDRAHDGNEDDDAAAAAQGDLGLHAFRRPADQQGLSLDQLNEAFAAMLGAGDDPYAAPDDPAVSDPPQVEATSDDVPIASATADDAACAVTPRSILEALLFVGRPDNSPLTSQEVATLMRGVRPEEIDELVRELDQRYAHRGCPYRIRSIGPGYRLVLDDAQAGLREKFAARIREARLSQAAVDVLSIVAYQQPIAADQVSRLRGKPAGAILTQLVRRQLLAIQRSPDQPRHVRYATTARFLELFGLENLSELPRHDDVEVG
jgi:segregation and condensation protein B